MEISLEISVYIRVIRVQHLKYVHYDISIIAWRVPITFNDSV